MLELLIDAIVAWLLVKYVPDLVKRMLLGLVGGWLAAIAGSLLVGLAFGWPLPTMFSRLTVGLLVHPLIVGGFVWLLETIMSPGKRQGTAT